MESRGASIRPKETEPVGTGPDLEWVREPVCVESREEGSRLGRLRYDLPCRLRLDLHLHRPSRPGSGPVLPPFLLTPSSPLPGHVGVMLEGFSSRCRGELYEGSGVGV